MHIGSAVHLYMDEVLKGRAYTEQTYNACRGILRLHKQYGADRSQAACTRALAGNVFNYRTIQNILTSNLDQLMDGYQPDLFKLQITLISGARITINNHSYLLIIKNKNMNQGISQRAEA